MIYVDQFPDNNGWGMWRSGGHMMGTSLDELHQMADRLGLKRVWFQDKFIPHYDLVASKRKKAIELGAVEIAFGELPEDIIRQNATSITDN